MAGGEQRAPGGPERVALKKEIGLVSACAIIIEFNIGRRPISKWLNGKEKTDAVSVSEPSEQTNGQTRTFMSAIKLDFLVLSGRGKPISTV